MAKKIIICLSLFLLLFVAQPTAAASTVKIRVIFRDYSNNILKNTVNFGLYLQKYDSSNQRYIDKKIAGGKPGDSGVYEFTLNVTSNPGPYVIKAWTTNEKAGEYYFWNNGTPNAGTTYTYDLKLENINFIIKDADGLALKSQKFNLYKQGVDVNGQRYKDTKVGSFSTGQYGSVKVFVAPGTYVLEVPISTGTLIKYDIALGAEEQKNFEYKVSNFAVIVRDGFGQLIPKARFDIVSQKTDVDGKVYLDKKIGTYDTNASGRKEVALPAGTYAIKFYGYQSNGKFWSDKMVYTFWDNVAEEGLYKEIEYKLSTVRLSTIDALHNVLKNQKLEIWEQKEDVAGQNYAGVKLLDANTGTAGQADLFVSPGKYLLKIIGVGGQDYYYWNLNVNPYEGKILKETLSSLRVISVLGKNMAGNMKYSVYTQKTDVKGNYLVDKKIIDSKTGTTGYSDISLPPGKYALGFASGNMTYNLEIKQNQMLVVTLKVVDSKTGAMAYIGQYYMNKPGKTPPSEEAPAKAADSDKDGLTDEQESAYKTNPRKADTDGDGYNDYDEVLWGFNPNLSGDNFIRELYVYNRPRLNDLEIEKTKIAEFQNNFKLLIDENTYSQIKNWDNLAQDYLYGGYDLKSIAQNIKYPGKTVDPNKFIRFSGWQLTQNYRDYINKK